MAFPTNATVIDDFSPNDAHPMAGWTDLANGLDAVSGVCKGTVSDNISYSHRTTPTYGPNSEVYVTTTTKTQNTYGFYIGCRHTTLVFATTDGYYVYAQTASGTDSIFIFRCDNGALTQLGSTIAQEYANGDAIGLEVIGTTNNIKAYYKASGGSWGQIGTTQSDNNYTAAGYLALGIEGTTGAADGFSGGTVVVAGNVIPVFMNQYARRSAD